MPRRHLLLRLPIALARVIFVFVVGAAATTAGTVVALTQTGPGRSVVAKVLGDRGGVLVRGSITVRRIEGNFFRTLALDSLEVRDTSGALLALFPRVEARWQLRNLVRGRILLEELRLERPRLHLVQHRGGRMNYQEVLRSGESPPGGRGPLVEFRNVRIDDGIVTIRTPWNPPGQLRTEAQRDSALRDQRKRWGKRIEPGPAREGLQQIRTIEGFGARLPRLRIQTPEKSPLLAIIDSLSLAINDPLLTLTDLRGEVTQARDTLWFRFDRASLPGTIGRGEGLAAWPQDTVLFNFSFDAERVSLADLRFVSPEFPDFTGRGQLEAYSYDGTLTEYRIPALSAGDSVSSVTGSLVALVHQRRGLGFRGLDLAMRNLDLEVVRPYLDTLPFIGRLSGRLRADGYFERMRVALDWDFFDHRISGQPGNHLVLDGEVTLGGPEGMTFYQARVTDADFDLPTARLAASAVILEGRARAAGTLDGPWKDVTFTGQVRHQDGDRPETSAEGRVRLNTRDTAVVMDADLDFAPLDFEGIRRAFPTFPSLGSITGKVRLIGRLDSMQLAADVTGEIGSIRARGLTTLLPPRWGGWPLTLDVRGLDLHSLQGTGPSTHLTGQIVLDGAIDSLVAPEGAVAINFGPGAIRELQFDTLHVRMASRDNLVTVDSAAVAWFGGGVRASGSLGWAKPHSGTMTITGSSSSLVAFDSAAAALAGLEPDSTGRRARLDGVVEGKLVLSGALDSLNAAGEGVVTDLRWAGSRVSRATGALTWRGGSDPALTVRAAADSVAVAGLEYAALAFEAEGPMDSLVVAARGQGANGLDLQARGIYREADGRALMVQDLLMNLRGYRWHLDAPFTAAVRDSVVSLTPVRLERTDGGATLLAEGTVPGRNAGTLDVRSFGLDLRDLYALAQRDTTGVAGTVTADARVSGTASSPVVRGIAAVTGPVFGDFRAPLVQTAFFYRDERLQADLKFWRTGVPVIEVSAGLPLDLAWQRTRRGGRQLPGPLAIRAHADSMDLGLLEAFTRNLRRMRGTVDMDVTVGGSWETPRLGGTVAIHDGGATVPSLGVRYGPINGRFTLSGDSIRVDSLRINGERGGANLTGQVRLDRLTRPILELDMRARGFSVMDVPGFLTLELDADAQFRGPLVQPVLTGRGTVRNTVLYFADLVSKSIVNLEDPLYADLVDTLALREGGLRAEFQSRFLDSLTIRDLSFRAAEGVWLRSTEANIQLEGQATVNKVRQVYRLDGTFNALRGTYTLRVGPISRAFNVTRGVVRYLGDPDLNADLDVEARHVIKAASAEASARDLEITARIGGTLRTPRLALESSIRPPLSQSDIISLLLLGQTVNSQVASPAQSDRFAQALSLLAGTLTSEIERSLMQGTGSEAAPDLIEIRPGLGYGGVASGASLTRLSAGWNLGTRWFVSINAGFCPGFQQFDFRNFGASLDYQFNRSTSFAISGEPVQTCLVGAAGGIASKRYQLGGDLQWQREF
jgi:translocation and assembly module TamB